MMNKCSVCKTKIERFDSILESVSRPIYDRESMEWVVMCGYLEKAMPCGHVLGDGYGDVQFFHDEQTAQEYGKKLAPLIRNIISDELFDSLCRTKTEAEK